MEEGDVNSHLPSLLVDAEKVGMRPRTLHHPSTPYAPDLVVNNTFKFVSCCIVNVMNHLGRLCIGLCIRLCIGSVLHILSAVLELSVHESPVLPFH